VDLDLDGRPTAGVPHPAAVELGDPRVCHCGATFRSSDDRVGERCPCRSAGASPQPEAPEVYGRKPSPTKRARSVPAGRHRNRCGGAGREREGKGEGCSFTAALRANDSAIVQSCSRPVKRRAAFDPGVALLRAPLGLGGGLELLSRVRFFGFNF
jgi:hypothetical protein